MDFGVWHSSIHIKIFSLTVCWFYFFHAAVCHAGHVAHNILERHTLTDILKISNHFTALRFWLSGKPEQPNNFFMLCACALACASTNLGRDERSSRCIDCCCSCSLCPNWSWGSMRFLNHLELTTNSCRWSPHCWHFHCNCGSPKRAEHKADTSVVLIIWLTL